MREITTAKIKTHNTSNNNTKNNTKSKTKTHTTTTTNNNNNNNNTTTNTNNETIRNSRDTTDLAFSKSIRCPFHENHYDEHFKQISSNILS